MRLIDADALHEALKTKQMWVVRCGDKHNEGYTYDQVHFAIDEAPTIEAVSIDDYRSMVNTCYKLQKALEEMVESKTENSSEKPNNCEPKICDTCRYYNSNIPCGSTPSACKEADKFAEEFVDGLKKLKSKDEPQTELVNDSPILVKDLVDDEFNPYDEECMRCKHLKLQCEFVPSYCKYEPRDEPQTDCAWK